MDSFCNMIMTYTVLSKLGINIEGELFKSRFQGDDAILSFPEPMFDMHGRNFLAKMAEEAMLYFNAKLSDDKSGIGHHPNTLYALGYNVRNGAPYRTDEDLLSHLFYPERPQDYGRLAASAMGLAHASLGCSQQFFDLCQDIWNKIVIEKGHTPDYKQLKWMKRAGMEHVLEALETAEFPEFNDILSNGITPRDRTEREKQRTWPTIPKGLRNEIVFINKV